MMKNIRNIFLSLNLSETNYFSCKRSCIIFFLVSFMSSTRVIYISNSEPAMLLSSRDASLPFIGSLYILAGLSLLFAVILRTALFRSLAGLNAFTSVTFALTLAGLIMAKMRKSSGTINRSKFVVFFAVLMTATLFQVIGVVAVIVGQDKARNGRNSSEVFKYSPLVSACLFQGLVVVSSIILITMTSCRDTASSPKFALPSKLLMGIGGIIASICGVVRIILLMNNEITGIYWTMYYIQVACVSLIGLGIIVGIIISIINHKKMAEQLPTTCTPPPVIMATSHVPSAPVVNVQQ